MSKVTLAYLHPNEVSANFHHSLVGLLMTDAGGSRYLMHPDGQKAVRCGTDGLVQGRNLAVEEFLESDVEWLFWVDSDMGFAGDILNRLMASADPETKPIVGGLCFVQWEVGQDGMLGHRTIPRPTVYSYDEGRFKGSAWYPVNSVVETAATGSACVLIHRKVFADIAEQYGPIWYDRIKNEHGTLMGEDVSFCARAQACGHKIHINTGAKTNHQKTAWVSEADFWMRSAAPPATERTTVIVPVHHRPANAAPFMRSLRASTGLVDVIAVAQSDDGETIAAWEAEGVRVQLSEHKSFAHKVNVAFEVVETFVETLWVFLVGDDVHFHARWLDHLQWVASQADAKVIGSNDLGNPAVIAGDHATHMMISSQYIRDVGASWDGPGKITHDGYRHNFVDNEIVEAAKQRGVWSMALGSLVEHLHPAWDDKRPMDETYRLGQISFERDHKLFEARYREHVMGEKAHSSKGLRIRSLDEIGGTS